MKVSIKTIKITSVISALSLVIALLMGAEYFKDASQIYLFGISWVTLQNTAFGIFGSAALAAVSAGIIYGVDKEAYLNKSEQYLIHVCTKSKTAFVQLTEANKLLENGILSKNEKATFTGVSTIVSFIETQQEAIQPASMQQLSNLQKTRQSLQESSNIVKMVRRSGWAPRNLKLRFLN